MITKFKDLAILWRERKEATYIFAPNGTKFVCTFYSLFAANTCSRSEVRMLGPKLGAFIARPFSQVNHHRPIADILFHVVYVNKTTRLKHVPRYSMLISSAPAQ